MSPSQDIECYITATLLDCVDSLKPNLESDGYRVIAFNPSDDPSPDIIIPQLSLGFIYIDISDAEIECKQVDSMIDNLISRILNLENDIKNMSVIAHIPDQKSAEYKIEASVNAFCRLQNILLENASLQYQPHIFPIHFAAELTSVTQQVVLSIMPTFLFNSQNILSQMSRSSGVNDLNTNSQKWNSVVATMLQNAGSNIKLKSYDVDLLTDSFRSIASISQARLQNLQNTGVEHAIAEAISKWWEQSGQC